MDASDARSDPTAWLSDVVDRYQRPLLAYAARMLGGDIEAAQDAVQETFLRLCRASPADLEERIAAWLFAVCRSRVIDMQRTQTRQPSVTDRFDTSPPADPAPDPASATEDADRASQLARLIEQLAPGQQEVLRLRLDAGLSYREIAEATGRSVGSVSSQLHDAVRNLRQATLQA